MAIVTRRTRRRRLWLLASVVALTIGLWLFAALKAPDAPDAAFQAPAFQTDVLDEAGILSNSDQDDVRRRIRELRENEDVWAAVYIAASLHGETIEGVATAVFEKWKLGQKGKDNGLLVVFAPKERKMRIEVGYGLEHILTDAFTKSVQVEIYRPAFRRVAYARGLMLGFDAIAEKARGATLNDAMARPASEMERFDWLSAGLWSIGIVLTNLAPAYLYRRAFAYGRRNGRAPKKASKGQFWILDIFCWGLGAFFGLFAFAMGGFGDLAGWHNRLVLIAFNLIFIAVFMGAFAPEARRLVSATAYHRHMAKLRLYRIRRLSKEPRKVCGVWFDPAKFTIAFGGTQEMRWSFSGSSRSRSSSSGSSWSSSSSSSGGGSSGGGGSSSDW
jgi:uncharacterized protein